MGPSEAELLARLDELVAAGRVELTVDRRKLSHIDFPLALEADGNRWLYLLLALVAAAFWAGGIVVGLAAAVMGCGLYLTAGRATIQRRLERRIRDRALRSQESWRKVWRFGGVILTQPGESPCQGPGGNWMAFVRSATTPE